MATVVNGPDGDHDRESRVGSITPEVFVQFAKRSSRDGQGGMPSRQIMLRRLSGINKQDVRKARKEESKDVDTEGRSSSRGSSLRIVEREPG